MSGVNKVIIIGNLGQDPEVRFMPNGKAAANFTVATSDKWKDKQTGEQKEKTEWHRITMFERLAEVAGEYLKKGSKVYLEGKLQTRKWQNQQGVDQYTTEILVNKLEMLDSKSQGTSPAPQQQGQQTGGFQPQGQQQGGGFTQQPSQQLAQKRHNQQASGFAQQGAPQAVGQQTPQYNEQQEPPF